MNTKIWLILLIPIFIILITAPALSGARVHRVTSGESLFIISRDYGVTITDIIETNNLKNSENIVPGQVLIIPPETVYYVRPGESLYDIAQNLEVQLEELIHENRITNPDLIYPDQVLEIPAVPEKEMLTTSVKIHTVQPGDTLYLISHQYGISIENLITLNSIHEPENLYPGDKLSIPEYSFSQLRVMYPEHFFHQGDSTSGKVALTFDDGPDDNYTPQILDVLNEHEISATFFYMGSRAERYPEVVQQAVADGHIIANHSWSHPDLTRLQDTEVYEEIKDTEIIMEETTGKRTGLLRPPYGLISQKILNQLKQLDYRVIQWNVDSLDWQDQDVDQILINTIPDIDDGAIILFHTAGGEATNLQPTVDVLPELIFTLKVQGYEFVTIDKLLDIPAYL